MSRRSHAAELLAPAAVAALLALAPRPAAAGEITLFLSRNEPRDTWRTGQGATLSLGVLKIAHAEIEGARGLDSEGILRTTYFTASGALKLPFSRVTPFVGLGVGVYHQSQGTSWKINTHGAAFVGIKARLADLIVVRGEYRRLQMRGTPFGDHKIDSRLAVGAGIAF